MYICIHTYTYIFMYICIYMHVDISVCSVHSNRTNQPVQELTSKPRDKP